MTETDPRLLGVQTAIAQDNLEEETHAWAKSCLKEDFKTFVRQPTTGNLRTVVAYLLTYQDSYLLGPHRRGYPQREESVE